MEAAQKAGKGKRLRPDVAAFDARREEEIARLPDELGSGSYRPGGYQRFVVREAKPRIISAAPFRDRVVPACAAACGSRRGRQASRPVQRARTDPGEAVHLRFDRWMKEALRRRF